jgi:predicted ABC-type ATPase
MLEKPVFYVIAGVNGSGKSSIGESEFNREGSPIFNPDTVAQQICTLHPNIPLTLANAHAWQIGKSLLEQAMTEDSDYRFETTLGGRTIAQLLENAARSGHRLRIWFCGLVSPELHLQRVRNRVAHGGHDIPEG